MSRLIMVIGMIVSLGGCADQPVHACAPGHGPLVSIFTLFFGRAIPGRADLTDREWTTFLDTTITANLPNGYTVMDAYGGWMNPVTHQTIQEATKLLLVALPADPASLVAVNRIRTDYQVKFQQQLVGMTVQEACGAF